MNKYLLPTEKKELNKLINNLNNMLYLPITKETEQILLNLVMNNKDASIEDLLDSLLNQLTKEITPLLDNHQTLGLQCGIKTNHFELTTYGGYYLSQNKLKKIEENTFFSFDSISKTITSIIAMQQIRNKKMDFNTPLNTYNSEYNLDATIESILKFTAYIKTSKRIDYLSTEETISLLKECKENLIEKNKYKNFYEYNDIGIMILRQIIPNFETLLNNLINLIDKENLTYQNNIHQSKITGGKIKEEYITPDPKGRGIPFPGHTGLYGNITGLLNLFHQLTNTEQLLTNKEKELLWTPPYNDPKRYTIDNQVMTDESNNPKYINKVAGIYRMPNNITTNYNKLSSFDISNQTTKNAKSSCGTCGSWVTSDNLKELGKYTTGILTNPYSFIENHLYPNKINKIPNTPLEVNQKGIIIGYPKHLNNAKEALTNYSLILKLLTEYIKLNEPNILTKEKIIKKKKSIN